MTDAAALHIRPSSLVSHPIAAFGSALPTHNNSATIYLGTARRVGEVIGIVFV